jgi:hypothetical protein
VETRMLSNQPRHLHESPEIKDIPVLKTICVHYAGELAPMKNLKRPQHEVQNAGSRKQTPTLNRLTERTDGGIPEQRMRSLVALPGLPPIFAKSAPPLYPQNLLGGEIPVASIPIPQCQHPT